ncbi:MAG: F-type H +-transporting ATPase subunit epsilon [Candidatus Magasanikbacteria bacterium]|nr:F-type H +-transporting ATPase subunit epsilon [Candidatus Magasanikbacteria bacterium]
MFEITTPERTVFKEDVDQITLPTLQGEITVLPHHLPLVSVIKPGTIRILKNGAEEWLAVAGGFIEVRPDNRVIVLADTAERAEEIDTERAAEARARAEKLLIEKKFDDVEYSTFAAKLERELARLRVAGRKRRGHGFAEAPSEKE